MLRQKDAAVDVVPFLKGTPSTTSLANMVIVEVMEVGI